MSFALRILLEGVRNRDWSVAEILAIHGVHCCVGGLETGKVHKGEPLRVARLRVTHNLRSLQDNTEGRERIVQKFLIDLRVQVTDENVRSHVQVLLVSRCLVHTNRFAVQFYHVHDFDGIIGILFTQELHESISLVHLCDSVFGHVDVDWKARLEGLVVSRWGGTILNNSPTGPAWTNSSQSNDSLTLSSSPPTYIVASVKAGNSFQCVQRVRQGTYLDFVQPRVQQPSYLINRNRKYDCTISKLTFVVTFKMSHGRSEIVCKYFVQIDIILCWTQRIT